MKTDKGLPDPPGPTPILYIKEGGVGEISIGAILFITIMVIILL